MQSHLPFSFHPNRDNGYKTSQDTPRCAFRCSAVLFPLGVALRDKQ